MVEIRRTEVYSRWINALADDRARSRIELRIYRLSLGNPGDAKSVGDGVSEMRVDYGPGYRVYFTQHGRSVIILLCGGNKRSQRKDVAAAKALAKQMKKE